jgi:hypothetical protein
MPAKFDSLSTVQRCHAKIYVIGLVAVSNKTVARVACRVLPTNGKRALNKLPTEYD